MFRPVMLARFRDALETVLREQLRGLLTSLDAFAWDVSSRADVFLDAGLLVSLFPSLAASVRATTGVC